MTQQRANWITWSIVGVFGLCLLAIFIPKSDSRDDWHFRKFASLPVQEGGRFQPIDTYARTLMKIINRREQYRDEKGDVHPASKWLLDVSIAEMKSPLHNPNATMDKEVFPIRNAEALEFLGLEKRKSELYTINEVIGHFGKEFKAANALKDQANLSDNEKKKLAFLEGTGGKRLMEQLQNALLLSSLDHKIFRIETTEVLDTLGLEVRPGFRYSAAEFIPHLDRFLKEARLAHEQKKRNLRETKLVELSDQLELVLRVANGRSMKVLPSPDSSSKWLSLPEVQQMVQFGGVMTPEAEAYEAILDAYARGEKAEFNRAVDTYWADLNRSHSSVMSKVALEQYFNEVAPFYYSAVLYTFVFLLACVSWLGWLKPELGWFKPLNRATFWSMVLILFVHSWALLIRMYLQGRPPVTNLYSSAIFIGWGCVITCVVVEVLFRNGIALMVGSVCGALSLLVAHFLGLSGDTLEMLVAVLDTNFWLATHVTCITFGYTACFVAGFTGIAFVLLGLFTRSLAKDGVTVFNKMIYGVICFATFLSFTGTVLGGIWADQSWGRFWGWDPKENGALLIVLWNALILHARWGGMIKPRGVAVLAILGNIVTAWSWFGVNMLSVGLHSYGFIPGAFIGLMAFVGSQLALAGMGLIPLKYWKSFAPPSKVALPEAGASEKQPVLAQR